MEEAQPQRLGEFDTHSPLLRHGVVVAGLSAVAFLLAPRASPFLLLLLAAPALAMVRGSEVRSGGDRAPLVAALIFGAYLISNALWSQLPIDAIGKALLFMAMTALLWFARSGLERMEGEHLDRLARAAVGGACVVLAYLLLEELTHHAVKRALLNWIPALRPTEKHIQLDGGTVTNIYLYVSNRNMAALSLALWPLLLMLASIVVSSRAWTGWRWLLLSAMLVPVAVAVGKSQHETSALALIFSAAAFGVAHLSRRLALFTVGAAWMVATLLIMPIVSLAYTSGLHNATWLPMSARHRVIIWGYTAELQPKARWLGVGIDSGKVLDARATPEQPPDHIYPRRTGTHSHNIYVQAWYDLGAVGAVLLCALGLTMLAAVSRLETWAQPVAFATFVTAATMAAFSWGMWQPWFMGAFGMAFLLLLVALERARRTRVS